MAESKNKHIITNPESVVLVNPKHLPVKKEDQTLHTDQHSQKTTLSTPLANDSNVNGFLALKKLKETEEHIRKIKGRFKVLKIKEQSFRAKTIHHQNFLKFNEETQKYRSQHKNELMKASIEREKQVGETKERNLKFREEIKQRYKQVRESMIQEKVEENKKIRQQSIQNDKKYKEIKIEDREEKTEKRNKIIELQRQQRVKVDRYRESRVNQTKEFKTLDMNHLLEKNSAKQKQLQELMRMEDEMQKEHMHSVEASRVLKVRLQSVINRRKANSIGSNISGSLSINGDTTKLPEINMRTSSAIDEVKN